MAIGRQPVDELPGEDFIMYVGRGGDVSLHAALLEYTLHPFR